MSRKPPVERASDEADRRVLRACRSARDRLIVLLMARAGLRRGELCGLRRGDVHLLPDSRALGCAVARAHLHVVRRGTTRTGRGRSPAGSASVPLDFLVVQAFDTYEFERMRVRAGAASDFVLVNLFRAPLGAPMRPDAVGELIDGGLAAGRAATCRSARTSCATPAAATCEMSRIAFDASFCSLRERRVPGVRGHGAAGGQVGDLARHA